MTVEQYVPPAIVSQPSHAPNERHITSVERGRERTFSDFTVLPMDFRVGNDTKYPALIFRPRHKEQFARTVTFTTPWCTELPGFNTIVGSTLAKMGMNVVAIGPEDPTVMRAVRNLGHTSLRADAHVQHESLDFIEEEGILDTTSMLATGYSRGGMIAFALKALEDSYERKIEYMDVTDPCLAKKVGLGDIPVAALPRYAANESMACVKSVSKHPLRRAASMILHAIPRSAGQPVQMIATGIALFSGEAGSFVDEWEEDTAAQVTLFTGSKFNHEYIWAKKLSRYPNVLVHPEHGYHLSGADPRVLDASVGRLIHAQRVLEYGGTGADIAHEFTFPDQLRSVSFD